MVAITETRKSIIDLINEVRRKLGYNPVTTLNQDAQSRAMVEFLNDVVSEVADYGNWQEMLETYEVSVLSSVMEYVVSATNIVHNIREVSFEGQVAELRRRPLEDLWRWQRINAQGGGRGVPRQYAINGVSETTGQPIISVYPVPSSAQAGYKLKFRYYRKPELYTTSTTATNLVPFPSRMISKGLQAAAYEDETALQQDYAIARSMFEKMMEETYNRYNGDTGNTTQFTAPSRGTRT